MNVIVYAMASRLGGALSVLEDFYKEVTENPEKYPDITWFFALSTQEFPETSNVKVIKADWAVKSWGHRAYYNLVTIKRAIKRYDIKAIVSLQNMSVMGAGVPSIVCLHNVLPLYKCDETVLDNPKQRLKQILVNRGIVNSLKGAYRVMVASEWIKDELTRQFGIPGERIVVSKLSIPAAEDVDVGEKAPVAQRKEGEALRFFYPASAYPYKNHKVIVEACKRLKAEEIHNYEVVFTIHTNQGKNASYLAQEVDEQELPISFVGSLQRELVLQAYRDSVLLFPSRIENDAMPLLECMQYGGYTLAADLPYARDVLDSYSGKQYFTPEDAETLAKQMKELILHGVPQVENKAVEQPQDAPRPEKVAAVLRELETERK